MCTGLYSTFIVLFSNPLEVCLAMASSSRLKTNATTLQTVLVQNNQIRIGEKGEVSRKENIVSRFMSSLESTSIPKYRFVSDSVE